MAEGHVKSSQEPPGPVRIHCHKRIGSNSMQSKDYLPNMGILSGVEDRQKGRSRRSRVSWVRGDRKMDRRG